VVHGIGRNGHIGFNEPGSPADSDCRQVVLARSTLCANFPGEPERRRFRNGLTLGLRQLRRAKFAAGGDRRRKGGGNRTRLSRAGFGPMPGIDPADMRECDGADGSGGGGRSRNRRIGLGASYCHIAIKPGSPLSRGQISHQNDLGPTKGSGLNACAQFGWGGRICNQIS